jgi:hypothetical protein
MEPQQQQALTLLASGKSVDEISETLDIHRTTLWRWRKNPEFIARFNQLIQQGKEKQIQSFINLQQRAFEVFEEALSSENELLRFKAATVIIDKVKELPEGLLYEDEILESQRNQEQLRKLTSLDNFQSTESCTRITQHRNR